MKSTLRFAAAGAAILMVAAAMTGCTSPPAPLDGPADLDTATAAHDDLIHAAAIIVTGHEVEPEHDVALTCRAEERNGTGVEFNYMVIVPADGHWRETFARIAEKWTELSLDIETECGPVSTPLSSKDDPTKLVRTIGAFRPSALEGKPTRFQFAGNSRCVPSEPSDYYSIADPEESAP